MSLAALSGARSRKSRHSGEPSVKDAKRCPRRPDRTSRLSHAEYECRTDRSIYSVASFAKNLDGSFGSLPVRSRGHGMPMINGQRAPTLEFLDRCLNWHHTIPAAT